MPHPKLQTTTAIALAMLYLVVGLAGESLHYLAESASTQVTGAATESQGSDATHAHGYHHFHGPDFHVHYHGPVKRARNKPSPNSETSKQQRRCTGVAFEEPVGQHQPHACPLLAVLSTLKLGQGELPSWSLETTTCLSVDCERQVSATCGFTRLHLARGPPSLRIV